MTALLAGVGAAVAAFVLSGAYYAAFSSRLASLSPAYAGPRRPPVVTAVVELVRNVVLATVIGGIVAQLQPGLGVTMIAALGLWIGFPVANAGSGGRSPGVRPS